MCKISKLYNRNYICNHLKNNKLLIANACDNYDKATFEEYKLLYEKYSDDFICDWFPKLWAIIFYRNAYERSAFLEMMNAQLENEISINSYNHNTTIEFEDNRAVIIYNSRYNEYITFDKERNVG